MADSQVPSTENKDQKPSTDVEGSQSLAPPPRPAASSAADTPDYFNSVHNPFSLEPNPFEQSFSNTSSAETPGKSLLPPVAALTSPALPGTSSAGGYNWPNSLRSGPLSPAMLAGPAGSTDYFDSIGRGFPTPNESSLRTGLTPGGGGSMFPAPSPNSQAILSQLQSGGATPSTLEFHRTALNAAKRNGFNAPTSNPTTESEQLTTMETKTSQPAVVDPFTHHDAADAANGLFMLAKGGQANNNQFSNQSSLPPQNIQNKPPEPAQDANVTTRASRTNANNAVTGDREMTGDGSDTQGDQAKPAAKGKGKKSTSTKSTTPSTGRRKADDTAAKGSNKKAKTNNEGGNEATPEQGESEQDDKKSQKTENKDPKKMTDEEKRRNFLERNRYVFDLSRQLLVSFELALMEICLIVSLRSSADSARSSGLLICRPRLNYSPAKMMLLQQQSPSFVKRLST